MSCIFGTYHRDQGPADPKLWERLGKATAQRGPDGTVIKASGPVLLGNNILKTTAESLQETLPYFCATTGLAITADARLDNRIELLHALGIKEELEHPTPDSKIILSAYSRWGESSFCRLLGDFSFVIWDSIKKELVCVRDSLGVKPFYYVLPDRLFSFSSEMISLVKHPRTSGTVNEGMIGEHLAAKIVSKTETLYRDILRLEPGHAMTVTPDAVHYRRYWEPDFGYRLRYTVEQDYVDHFREIFSEVVGCRLRSHLPVSFELSGGLDSSSIVGMAHGMVSEASRDNFLTCSLIYPGLACNEQNFTGRIESHLGISTKYINYRPPLGVNGEQGISRPALPDPPNLSNSEPLLSYVQQKNSRVLLTGIGGDEWFSGSDYSYLDLLSEKKCGTAVREFKRNFTENRKKTCARFSASIAWPLVPFSLKKTIIHRKRRHNLYPSWISEPFARKINLEERLLEGACEPHVTNLATLDSFTLFHTGYESNVLEKNAAQKGRYQIEGRHPFLDRRLVEFAIALPSSMHRQNGISKHILRLAGEKYLPDTIRKRHSKAEFSELYYHVFKSKIFADTLKNSKVYDNGWIDKHQLLNGYENNLDCFRKNESGPCPDTLPIWFAFAVSSWYGHNNHS